MPDTPPAVDLVKGGWTVQVSSARPTDEFVTETKNSFATCPPAILGLRRTAPPVSGMSTVPGVPGRTSKATLVLLPRGRRHDRRLPRPQPRVARYLPGGRPIGS